MTGNTNFHEEVGELMDEEDTIDVLASFHDQLAVLQAREDVNNHEAEEFLRDARANLRGAINDVGGRD